MSATYSRDNLGQLKSVTLNDQVISYALDWDGRRVAKRLNGVNVSRHTFESSLRVAMDVSEEGVQRHYVYGSGINSPDYMILNGENFRLVKDHLGSPRLVISANTGTIVQRMDFNEWGEVLFDSNPGFQGFGFAGGLYDQDTKLVKFGARDYSPAVGRWLSKDPIGFAGGDANLYGYVLQDPVNSIDPTGLSSLSYVNGVLTVYSNNGQVLATFYASNNAQRSSNGPFQPGQYSFSHHSRHTGADATSNGRYGTNGNFVFNVSGRSGMGVHSGRADSCDKAGRCGANYSTDGCIRTSDEATSFLKGLHKVDPIRSIRIGK